MSLRSARSGTSGAPLVDHPPGGDGDGANRVLPVRPEDTLPAALSDEALVAACAVGDRAALAVLFQRHHQRLHRFCARLVDAAEIDDLVQSTFVAA